MAARLKVTGIKNTRGALNKELNRRFKAAANDTRKIAEDETHKDTGRLSKGWRVKKSNSTGFEIDNNTPYADIEFEYHPEQLKLIQTKSEKKIRRIFKTRKNI